MNQSVIDLCASIFVLLTAVVEVDGTRMSRDSVYDQFVCRIWLTRVPLWALQTMSTYGILIIALERYIAVIYPIWYNVRVHEHFLYSPIRDADATRYSTHAAGHAITQNSTQLRIAICELHD